MLAVRFKLYGATSIQDVSLQALHSEAHVEVLEVCSAHKLLYANSCGLYLQGNFFRCVATCLHGLLHKIPLPSIWHLD